MDCQSCQPTLIDLGYGELAPAVADAARDHIDGCADCRAQLERLQSGLAFAEQLPLEEPPQRVSAHLLQLAESHAAESSAHAHAIDAPPQRSPWTAMLEFIRRFAMAPQVGMATIFLLVVAVGLWSVPQLSKGPEVAGDTVVNPDPEGEATAHPGVQPAEPLDLRVDMRNRRIRSKDDEQRAQAPAAQAAEAEPMLEAKEEVAAAAEPAPELDLEDLSDVAVPLESLGKGMRGAEGKASGGGAGRSRIGMPAASEQSAPQAFPKSAPKRKARARAKRAPAPASAPSPDPRYGSELRRDGDLLEQAAPPNKSSAPAAPATSQIARAREVRRPQGCAAALPHDQKALAGAGRTRETGEALIEMAECEQQLGRPAVAKKLLEGAAQVPAVAARARAMLDRQAAPVRAKSKKKPAAPAADALAAVEK